MRAHGNFAVEPATAHLRDLMQVAHEQGFNPSPATLAGAYYVEKRKQAKMNDELFAEPIAPVEPTAPTPQPKRRRLRRRSRRNRRTPVIQPVLAQNGATESFDLFRALPQIREALQRAEAELKSLREKLLAVKRVIEELAPGEAPEQS